MRLLVWCGLWLAQLESYRFPEHFFERLDVTVGRPQLELRIVCRAKPRQIMIRARVEIESRHRLRVASIQPFRQPDHCREPFHRFSELGVEAAVPLV